MNQINSKRWMALVAGCALWGLMLGRAGATTVTGGATLYGNPFNGVTISSGAIGGGPVTASGLTNVISQRDSRTFNISTASGRIQSSDGATQGYMQFVAPTSFTAGTVISAQTVDPLMNTAQSYTLKLDGNVVATGAGTPGTHAINVATLPTPVSATTLRAELNLSIYNSVAGTRYGDMQEVLILPDKLSRLTATPSQLSGSTTYGTVSGFYDLSGVHNPTTGAGGWAGSANSQMRLDFGSVKPVYALVLANWENIPVSFDIQTNGTAIASVTMATYNSNTAGEFVAIKFNSPVTTQFLDFQFTGSAGLREVIALTIPEPSTLFLLGVGGLWLYRWRKRK